MFLTSFVRARRARLSMLALATLFVPACTSPSSPSHPTVFQTVDLVAGSGTEAVAAMTLMVNYKGWLYDPTKPDLKGSLFDSNPAGFPFVFRIGVGQVIEGWDKGIPGMKVGGLRKLIIPPELAYGRNGAGGSIPPNASLVFEVELLSVATSTVTTSGG